MSDRFYRIPIERLFKWIIAEEKEERIFGLYKELFFTPTENDAFRMNRYGRVLETPIGVAAGPQTQLAHNIIASWLCGARYIELKTVQTLDEIEVTKPCIDMEDEGYNCEWSQELKVKDSFDERSEEHTSELQSHSFISYAVFCLKKQTTPPPPPHTPPPPL